MNLFLSNKYQSKLIITPQSSDQFVVIFNGFYLDLMTFHFVQFARTHQSVVIIMLQ